MLVDMTSRMSKPEGKWNLHRKRDEKERINEEVDFVSYHPPLPLLAVQMA